MLSVFLPEAQMCNLSIDIWKTIQKSPIVYTSDLNIHLRFWTGIER